MTSPYPAGPPREQGKSRFRHNARRLITHPYLYIFLAAVILRILLFALAVGQAESLDRFTQLPPDARFYTAAADSIRTDLNYQTRGVQIFGPGYPTLLALMGGLVGTSPGAIIPLQILVTAFGSVLLAMLAFRLIGDRRIAVIAGGLNALSVSGIGLASVLLSDSLFFVMFTAGLLFFLFGLEARRQRWLWLAGVVLGICALTRSVAVFSFAILAILAVSHAVPKGENWRTLLRRRWKPLALTTACLFVISGAWVVRNHRLYGVTYLSQATPAAMARMSAIFRQDVDGTPTKETFKEFGDSLGVRTETTGNRHTAYADVAREMFLGLLSEHPFTCLRAFLRIVDESVHSDWSVLISVLPDWDRPIRIWTRRAERLSLNYRVAILSAIGLVILWRRRQRGLAVSLLAIYLYFGLLTGFNPWQGNRVFYPGQIAWSVLVAVALLWIYEVIRRRVHSPRRDLERQGDHEVV